MLFTEHMSDKGSSSAALHKAQQVEHEARMRARNKGRYPKEVTKGCVAHRHATSASGACTYALSLTRNALEHLCWGPCWLPVGAAQVPSQAAD